ncbi:D-alanine--D-alanine ligase [Rhodovulum sulfidophilum]|uniref:D-alanine--D-alanine ligase n=2 Tax=Rhodovulum visakhapatnamense TaxID=364297 RepID=A0ABS1RIN1_9RHOB|nr:D-alanine--D-alanine ligase [Rhodovulum visakhapatnamense]MBL3579503.1 D-alanine--D-alanine ligase [Rhodovulum visakhapatnamense]OLS45648.1 D-alanine--D-alanine ligase [Rhodovulum sulfidophilum]
MAGESSRTAPRVAVLMGGPSSEREVSLSSGRECAIALRGEGFDVIEVDAGQDLPEQLRASAPDVVFNALHGRWGEDGCVQGLLEWLRLPYTHSGVLASALAMDKQRSKEAYRAAGLPVVESRLASKAEVSARHVIAPPYVVKPNNEGSSVGIHIVHEAANAPPQLGAEMPEIVMVETYAPGRELTTTVMGDRALTVTDILTDGWYDYHAKYAQGGSRHVVPADLPAEVFEACLDFALRAHDALGCRGVSRTDFRWDDSRGLDGLILLETNTQPGMTPTSLAPEQAAQCGISFGQLCRWLVEDASCDR